MRDLACPCHGEEEEIVECAFFFCREVSIDLYMVC